MTGEVIQNGYPAIGTLKMNSIRVLGMPQGPLEVFVNMQSHTDYDYRADTKVGMLFFNHHRGIYFRVPSAVVILSSLTVLNKIILLHRDKKEQSNIKEISGTVYDDTT